MTGLPVAAAVERESHSVRSAWARALHVWFALLGSIGAWIVHLVVLASLAPSACAHTAPRVAMHATTVGCAAVAVAALALGVRLARRGDVGDPRSPSWLARRGDLFLGRLAVLIGVVDLALIVFEELDVVALVGVACG